MRYFNYKRQSAVLESVLHVIVFLVVLIGMFCGLVSGASAQPFRGPWEGHAVEAARLQPEHTTHSGSSVNPLHWLVKFYRNYISPIDGKDCPMYPSCSDYSLRSFRKHGFFMGWFMTTDRLLHEANEIRQAPVLYINGARLYDPLENNDFWWHYE